MADKRLLDVDDARRAVLEALPSLGAGEVELDAALGRVLARDVAAPFAVPPFDSSAMDGFAVRASDVAGARAERPARLRLVGESRAGSPAQVAVGAGEAVAISTGAALPPEADAIVRVEDSRTRDGQLEALCAVGAGADVRRAGDDIQAGRTVLARGSVLGPGELGVLASLGHSSVPVADRPRTALLVTGDELRGPGEDLVAGAIRDTNSFSIAALVRCAGGELARRERVRDEAAATTQAIEEAAHDSDVVVICGGVSVGAHDHVRASLAALGAQQAFWGIALKPGRPTWFGTLDGVPVFGLPGNPVSAIVTFVLLADPALRALQGASPDALRAEAILDQDYEKPRGRAHALRCRLRRAEDGWHATPTGAQGSHVLTSMLDADALAIAPTEATALHAGDRVRIELLRPWLTGSAA
ncbi:MAG TPA: gephyrin-like molybdotransferase Glp [Solirubrobacteraceae bacterium]|jgi:molybdopterin molybdotransferase|nr:gephyrin-like molybdotransferase Glp [Solirubrobacteraceae bacterium]